MGWLARWLRGVAERLEPESAEPIRHHPALAPPARLEEIAPLDPVCRSGAVPESAMPSLEGDEPGDGLPGRWGTYL